MQMVFRSEERVDQLCVGFSALFFTGNVCISAEATCDIAGHKRVALECGDDTDSVDKLAVVAERMRLDCTRSSAAGESPKASGVRNVLNSPRDRCSAKWECRKPDVL